MHTKIKIMGKFSSLSCKIIQVVQLDVIACSFPFNCYCQIIFLHIFMILFSVITKRIIQFLKFFIKPAVKNEVRKFIYPQFISLYFYYFILFAIIVKIANEFISRNPLCACQKVFPIGKSSYRK